MRIACVVLFGLVSSGCGFKLDEHAHQHEHEHQHAHDHGADEDHHHNHENSNEVRQGKALTPSLAVDFSRFSNMCRIISER